MAIEIHIPTALRQYADQNSTFEVGAGEVHAALNELTTRFPKLRPHLFTEDGKLRNFVNVFLNDENIRHLSGDELKLKDGDSISIVPAVAGGR